MLNKIKKIILDLLFPIACLGCGKEGEWLCDNCLNTIPINQKFVFPQAEEFFNFSNNLNVNPHTFTGVGVNLNNLEGILIASSYKNELLNKAIKTFKYNFIFGLAKPLAKILINFLNQFDLKKQLPENFLLIPIPLHKKRLIWRGFNQSELLVQEIGEFFNIEVNSNILKRIKNTQPQTELKEKERQKNVKNIFTLSSDFPKQLFNKKIILIDDVTTTGSTLEEASKIFKKSGFKQVWGLVLAKG